jgi:hypothetical protein
MGDKGYFIHHGNPVGHLDQAPSFEKSITSNKY